MDVPRLVKVADAVRDSESAGVIKVHPRQDEAPAVECVEEIGAQLDISEDTVAVHLRNTFVKLKVNERTTAVTVALRRGIIHLRR